MCRYKYFVELHLQIGKHQAINASGNSLRNAKLLRTLRYSCRLANNFIKLGHFVSRKKRACQSEGHKSGPHRRAVGVLALTRKFRHVFKSNAFHDNGVTRALCIDRV
jgi:hypothetical protein